MLLEAEGRTYEKVIKSPSANSEYLVKMAGSGKHCPLSWYHKQRPESKDYFSFVFVRNPWDKMVSEYYVHTKRRIKGKRQIETVSHTMAFEDFIKKMGAGKLKDQGHSWHFKQQVGYLESGIEFVGRFENYLDDIKTVLKKLDVPDIPLPHVNKSKRTGYQEYYTEETQQIVADLFADDIKEFGYSYG